jgi:hypothetical protein
LPMLLTPMRSNVARAVSLSSPSALAELEVFPEPSLRDRPTTSGRLRGLRGIRSCERDDRCHRQPDERRIRGLTHALARVKEEEGDSRSPMADLDSR